MKSAMARPPSTQPTDGELEILKVLWSAGPAPLGAICAALRERRPVATTTVATMLKIMQGKGLVTRRRGSQGFVWSARATEETTARSLLRGLMDRVFDGSARTLVMHLIEDQKLSDEEVAEIRRLLDEHRAGK